MNTTLLSGKRLATLIKQRAQDEASTLPLNGSRPTLAVVVATDDESTHWYVRSIERAAENAGIGCEIVNLGPNAPESVLARALQDLNSDSAIDGIILQTPLPTGVRADALVGLIAPEKDIDGANPLSLGRLAVGQPAFAPATARSVVEILDHFQIPVGGRNVTVVGRSTVVGKPLSFLLLERDATVTVCHSKSGPLETHTKQADIVVVAAGRIGLLTDKHITEKTVVIDVGTNVLPDGSLVGDVDGTSVTGLAAALTPVPGGVGSVTTALLLLHTVEAAKRNLHSAAIPVG